MAADQEVQFEVLPYGRVYKSGRIEYLLTNTPSDHPIPDDVSYNDVTIDPRTRCGARLYLPKSLEKNNTKIPILIYFHGGGFFSGEAKGVFQRSFLTDLVTRANILIVSVEYRIVDGPNDVADRLPAAYEDSMTALKWVCSPNAHAWLTEHGDYDHVFIGGDSAGANITNQLTMQQLPEGVKIEGAALLCPYFWGTEPVNGEPACPVFRIPLTLAWDYVKSPDMKIDDWRINPVAKGAPSLAGLGCAKAFVCVATGLDPWHWRAQAYFEALKNSGWAGGVPELYLAEGEPHVFFLNGDLDSKTVQKFIASLATFLNPAVISTYLP